MCQSTCEEVSQWYTASKDEHVDAHHSTTQVIWCDRLNGGIGGSREGDHGETCAAYQYQREDVPWRDGKQGFDDAKGKCADEQVADAWLTVAPCQPQC